ncbi:MAG: Uma2 family endonuclease [Planctomycetaceae bacterium]
MSGVLTRRRSPAQKPPLLYSGDRLTQREFHRRYSAYPNDAKFELIGGLVYMASPVGIHHGEFTALLVHALSRFQDSTPGVRVATDATVILAEDSEPQPDACLWILKEYGGQTRITRQNYLTGGPELVCEVAHSSVAIDLHQKKDDYESAGVREYLVLCLEEQEIRWFDFLTRTQIVPDERRILLSRALPGFWLLEPALLARDSKALIKTVERGLASAEHAEFVRRLQAARKARKN